MTLAVGTKLGHFEIVELLGVGGMGEVYRALDLELERDVAVKLLADALSGSEERLTRLRREAKLLAAVNHPGVATLHGLEATDSRLLLVMELVEGETLAERIARGPVPIDEALPLLVQLAEGLEAAHEKGIVHRDLKPANIKITPEGRLKILDLGLAKAYGGLEPVAGNVTQSPTLTEVTVEGAIMGTASYMSPEQARGLEVDRRADIWAFGCVAYEMLSGCRAFRGATTTDTLSAVISSEPDWEALPPALPYSLERTLRLCITKEARNRLRDIGDARLDLVDAELNPEPVPVVTGSGAPRRGPWRSALWLLALVVVGAGGIAIGRFARPAPEASVAHFKIDLPAGIGLPFFDRALAFSPDGQQLALATYTQLQLRFLDRLEMVPVAGTNRVRTPFYSPDSKWVGFWQGGQLYKVALDGGAPIALCEAQSPYGASWGKDHHIVFGQGPLGIFEVSADGGEPRILVEPAGDEVAFHGPQRLPDGESLLFTVLTEGHNWNGAQIVAQRLFTGERRVLIEEGTDGRYLPTGHLIFTRGNTLLVVPFDPERLTVQGSPVPIQEGVWRAQLWESGAADFTVSDNGSFAYVPKPPPAERSLVWLDRDGNEELLPAPRRFYQHPRISPDGKYVVVDTVDTLDLWLYELERGTMARLTSEQTHLHPVWSSDGGSVLFDSTQGHGLYRKAVNEAGPSERLLTDRPYFVTTVSTAPDGRTLAFERSQHYGYGTFDIYVLPLDGDGTPRPFVADPNFHESGPMFSPDGRFVAYVSNETGRQEVYVVPFPDPSRKWLVSRAGGREPVWSPIGDELFYREGPYGTTLMAVPVSTRDGFTAGTPQRLFQGRYGTDPISAHPAYDVSRDGMRFLMTKTHVGADNPRELQVVLNWFRRVHESAPGLRSR